MAEENITLDPQYANLIIEVNKLKDKVAEKIAQRDMLAFHVIPDIENSYMLKIGVLENDAFMASMKLLRINRKIELYKERKKFNLPINENEIEAQLDVEFESIEEEYNEMQEDSIYEVEDDLTEKATSELLKLINIIYKNMIKKLSPLINFSNTRLDNQLYELLEKSYRELDLSMMSKLQVICEQIRSDSTLTIGDMKTLQKAKDKYQTLIDENEEIILNIKCSDSFDKKRILEDENLIRRAKEEINEEIKEIESEYKKSEKELKKLQNME
ncbi:MAG: hypothetical protein HFJ45_01900 [Clostridia bacterium]|nr:hypothetical protein [Clostridia bacterium]